jgi:hypothetical protein
MANINSLQGKWSKIQRVAFDPCPVLVRLNLSMRGDRYGKPVLLVEKVGTTPLVLVVNLGRERDGDAGAGGEAHFPALSDSLGFGDVYPTDSLTVRHRKLGTEGEAEQLIEQIEDGFLDW